MGEDHAGIMVLTDDLRRRARRSTEALPIADEVLDLEITPTGPTAWRSTASRARCTR